jgi:PAS domain S-box-containing protein
MEVRYNVDGEARWHAFQGICKRDEAGNVVRWTGSTTDVTGRKLAQEALRASEERYALAMDVTEDGHWDWNLETDEIFASARAKAVMDIPPDKKYRTRAELMDGVRYHPEDWARISEEWRAALSGRGLEHEFEFRILRGGEPRAIRARWRVFRDVKGWAYRIIGIVSDITERKQAVDTLRESEARFRRMTELSADTYWEQDENFRYTRTGEGRDIAGYPTDVNNGKTRWEMCGVTGALSGSWEQHRATLEAHEPFRDFEYRRIQPDGSVGYYSASGAPMFDAEGRFRGYQGVARNITERKRFEEELRSRQEMLELARRSARAVAFEWRMGESEMSSRWSPEHEAIYGLEPGTFDGSFAAFRKLVHPEDWPNVKSSLLHAQRTGEVDSEYRVIHPDGSQHWLQVQGSMFFDAAGKPNRSVGFIQDVTPRKQAEEELRKMELELRRAQRLEAMGTLAGGIAHDFNNILGAILGYGEMAMRYAKKNKRLHNDVSNIMAAGERGRSLVDRVLAFSRSGVAARVPVHVTAVVREALDQVEASISDDVTIVPRLRVGRAAILGDPTQVHQVVMNLAANGVQAMPEGGALRVSLEIQKIDSPRPVLVGRIEPGEHVVLKVADTGTGIRPRVLERMFDPFYTTKDVGVGSGLGLSLVHGIVTSIGGAIDVATEIGKGTTFTVYLPRSGDAPAKRVDDRRPLPRGEGQRVLVVDDEEPLVRLATETLEDLGYAPTGFTSSAAALAAFRADPAGFDAVLTDERMPGISGSALIREVRRIRGEVRVVLMSGYLGLKSVEADVVMTKPVSARDLATSMARALNS